ncbi:asparagine synthetase B [Terriglobus sp. YAF25]|uniref:asparagine synthetase B family protein n=1 Tax=Terriglobus sp. YAF25 TaxID=3233080 RepID=UPI003F9ACC04
MCREAVSPTSPHRIPADFPEGTRYSRPGLLLLAAPDSVCISTPELFLLLDGRIDNQRELASMLDLPFGTSLSELLKHAWHRWGEELPGHLIGDFAFAVWDGPPRKLLLARDVAGTRPLHFSLTPKGIAFASLVRHLLQLTGKPAKPDEERVAEWLGGHFHTSTHTFFDGIQTVAPGHTLIWQNGRHTVHSFWNPLKTAVLRLRDPREYVEGMLHHVEQAVRRRIPNHGLLATHLSGGLDSSTLTDTAARFLAPCDRSLLAFTAVPATPLDDTLFRGRFTDEAPFARAVAQRHSNIEHILISNHANSLFQALDRCTDATERPFLNPPNAVWLLAILQAAAKRGAVTLLNGIGGNFTLSYHGQRALPGLLAAGRIPTLSRVILGLHRNGESWKHILANLMQPFFPKMHHYALSFFKRKPASRAISMGASLSFLRRSGYLAERLQPSVNGRSERAVVLRGLDLEQVHMLGRTVASIDDVVPPLDRDLIEFTLSIPEEICCLDGDRRSLIRTTMKDRLPDMVRNERRRGLQAADFLSLLTAELPAIRMELAQMQQIDLVRRAIDLPRIQRLVERWPSEFHPSLSGDYALALPRALSMGRFLRRMEDGSLFSTITSNEVS